MRTLNMTLKKKWFAMILSGEKKEEYREIKNHWDVMLRNPQDINFVIFRNGYRVESPKMMVEVKGIRKGLGDQSIGAPALECYIIELGNVVHVDNVEQMGTVTEEDEK